MPAIGTITLNDGQSTPAAHSFIPAGVPNGLAMWNDIAGGIALGYPTVTLSVRRPTKGSRAFKATAKVTVPVLEQTSPSTATGIQPAPTLAYNLIANIDLVMPERATLAQRKDMAAYTKNFLANSVMTAVIENLESVW